jgi:hypothetical protein
LATVRRSNGLVKRGPVVIAFDAAAKAGLVGVALVGLAVFVGKIMHATTSREASELIHEGSAHAAADPEAHPHGAGLIDGSKAVETWAGATPVAATADVRDFGAYRAVRRPDQITLAAERALDATVTRHPANPPEAS